MRHLPSSLIKVRQVDFGTHFISSNEHRRKVEGTEDSRVLYRNEIAVDVGAECFGYEGCVELILDHHFERGPDNFPSATAAVLHLSRKVRDAVNSRFGDALETTPIWIVTHRNPDFDALASVYLVDRLCRGLLPVEGWEEFGISPEKWERTGKVPRINWFHPRLPTDPERRVAIALAAYAACTDNCRPIKVARSRSLHGVLYAAAQRDRPLTDISSIRSFFDAVYQRIAAGQLNPLIDELFEEAGEFAPELRFLRREEEVYERDVRRARRTILFVPRSAEKEKVFAGIRSQPLLKANGELQEAHLKAGRDLGFEPVDGIYLRDPECLLFKEWAREDFTFSRLGRGFLFTAIAYSRNKPSAPGQNESDYYFALDPERTAHLHLYPLWARLQGGEVQELRKLEANGSLGAVPDVSSRPGFESRAAGFERYFHDPWFDGANYRFTIVVTPGRGTVLKEGRAADLSDDEAARCAQEIFEWGIYDETKGNVFDFRLTGSTGLAMPGEERGKSVSLSNAMDLPMEKHSFRFVHVPLVRAIEKEADFLRIPEVAERIGRDIWPYLEPAGVTTVPDDFRERHIFTFEEGVGVWNRRGIAVASRHSDEGSTTAILKRGLCDVAAVQVGLRELTEAMSVDARGTENRMGLKQWRQKSEVLQARVLQLEQESTLPEGVLLRRFLQAIKFSEMLQTLQAVNDRRIEEAQENRDRELQIILAVGTAIGILLAWLQVEQLKVSQWLGPSVSVAGGLVVAIGFAAVFLWRISRNRR